MMNPLLRRIGCAEEVVTVDCGVDPFEMRMCLVATLDRGTTCFVIVLFLIAHLPI